MIEFSSRPALFNTTTHFLLQHVLTGLCSFLHFEVKSIAKHRNLCYKILFVWANYRIML